MSQPNDVVKQAGQRLAIAAAGATFLVSGLGLTLIMPRIVLDAAGDQDPAQFGATASRRRCRFWLRRSC